MFHMNCRLFKPTCKLPLVFTLTLFMTYLSQSYAQTQVTVEGNMTWQSRNDQRIPGKTGTLFSISDIDNGPFAGYRVYVGHTWNDRHEVRALYAPLSIEVDGQFDHAIDFQNARFAPNTPTTVFYKFNSYRLTYAYHFERKDKFNYALGFTGKIRDAEVRLEQAGLTRSKKNVGFVPLAHLQARYELSQNWQLRFDFDGLAAPQGRAIDAALFIEHNFETVSIFTGYRTIEGGADNDRVYNFAWIHQAVLGARLEF